MSTSQVSRNLRFRIFTGAFFLVPWRLLAACGGSVGADEAVEKAPAAGGDFSSGGTDNEGNQGSGSETAAAGSSTSLVDDLYVQISWQGRDYRFTQAPPVGDLFSGCESQSSPAHYAGGSCEQSRVGACNEEGDCILITDNHVSWTLANGTSRLELGHEPSTFQPNYLATEEFTNGPNGVLRSRAVGTILIEADAVTLDPDDPIELPITGSYSACVAGADVCLR